MPTFVLYPLGAVDQAQIIPALNAAAVNNGVVVLAPGNWVVTTQINIPAGVTLRGEGPRTSVNIIGIAAGSKSFVLGTGSQLSDMSIVGSLVTLRPEDLEIECGDDCTIRNLWLDSIPYGIDCNGKKNILIDNIRATNVRGLNGWAAILHGSGTSTNGVITRNIIGVACDRACEFEDGAQNVLVDGFIFKDCFPTHGVAGYTFVCDTHVHAGEVATQNITYRNGYIENSGGLTATSNDATNWPKNILFENITIKNPWMVGYLAFGFSQSINVTCRNVRVSGVTGTNTISVGAAINCCFERFFSEGAAIVRFNASGSVGLTLRDFVLDTALLNIVGTAVSAKLYNGALTGGVAATDQISMAGTGGCITNCSLDLGNIKLQVSAGNISVYENHCPGVVDLGVGNAVYNNRALP